MQLVIGMKVRRSFFEGTDNAAWVVVCYGRGSVGAFLEGTICVCKVL